MEKTYELTGMSCGGCVANVKRVLQNVPGIEEADVQLHPQKATLSMGKPVDVKELQVQLSRAGHYTIKEVDSNSNSMEKNVLQETKSIKGVEGKSSCCN